MTEDHFVRLVIYRKNLPRERFSNLFMLGYKFLYSMSDVTVKIGYDKINVAKSSRIKIRKTKTSQSITRQASQKGSFNLPNRRFPSIETTKPASSYPPLGELDRPIQLAQWRVESTMSNLGSALSSHSPELSPTSPDETVSSLISIGVTVEPLR